MYYLDLDLGRFDYGRREVRCVNKIVDVQWYKDALVPFIVLYLIISVFLESKGDIFAVKLLPMLKQLQMGLRAFMLLASRVWTCICFLIKKKVRAVSTLHN